MSPYDCIQILKRGGRPNPPPFVDGICGRILRGKTSQDFERLSDDPNRVVVMLTDSDGLAKFFGKSGYNMCITVGHHPDHIKDKVSKGFTYKLVVFPTGEATLATWDNVLAMAQQVYPDTAAAIAKHGPSLKKMKFSEVELQGGYQFKDADETADPRFMSHAAFQASDKGLVALRALLYHTLHLRELYRGDGFTYDEHGKRGVPEYLLLNKRISDIAGHVLHDLDVVIP